MTKSARTVSQSTHTLAQVNCRKSGLTVRTIGMAEVRAIISMKFHSGYCRFWWPMTRKAKWGTVSCLLLNVQRTAASWERHCSGEMAKGCHNSKMAYKLNDSSVVTHCKEDGEFHALCKSATTLTRFSRDKKSFNLRRWSYLSSRPPTAPFTGSKMPAMKSLVTIYLTYLFPIFIFSQTRFEDLLYGPRPD